METQVVQHKEPEQQAHAAIHSRPWAAWLIIIGGSGLLALAISVSVAKGSVNIPLATVWKAFFQFNPAERLHLIVMDLRLPRALASALVGAAFAVAGAIMQGITRNPMADSGLMGLNAGAGFALSLCFSFFPGLPYLGIIGLSFAGALLGSVLVFGIASMRRSGATPMRLVLAGAAVSALLAALSQGFALYYDVAQNIMFWTVGGMAGTTWKQLLIVSPWVIAALLGAQLLSRSVSLLSLGQEVAQGLGMNTFLVKTLCMAIVLMLAGAAVAVVGAVGFVGLIVPHIARFLTGVDYRWVIPSSAVLGSLLVVLADLGARTFNPPFETPIGVIIALVGVPFFLYLARKERRTL